MTAVITEKEAVEREREAWVAGCMYTTIKPYKPKYDGLAHLKYPPPKEERPRTVVSATEANIEESTFQFRIGPKGLEWACVNDSDWEPYGDVKSNLPGTAAFVAMWADLLANPTELVEDVP